MRYSLLLILCAAVLILSRSAQAVTRIAGVFADNMVLQRSVAIPVWGWAEPGEKITVDFAGASTTVTTDATGKWLAKIGPFSAGGAYDLTITGASRLTLRNILVGEVWLCAGQSNMQWPLSRMEHADEEISQADYPQIRVATIKGTATVPAADASASWAVCSPARAATFSAPGYFFGRALFRALRVPIGLIDVSEGSSPIRAWVGADAQQANACFRSTLEEDKSFADRQKAHGEAVRQAKADGTAIPSHVSYYEAYTHAPGVLYNARVAPLAPFAMQGVIWWQGENDASTWHFGPYGTFNHSGIYKDCLAALVGSWRELWHEGDFPFLCVQLAPIGAPAPFQAESHWAEVRDGQRQILKLKRTALVVTTDICEPAMHPRRKVEAGERLAKAARAIAYGETVDYSGPVFDHVTFADGKATVYFTHVDGGLVAKGGALTGFSIAGHDGQFAAAQAVIQDERVVVWSAAVPDPKTVCYAWSNNPTGNLFNRAGLPASCFRSND